MQGALGVEFTLAGLNKAADATYGADFEAFVLANPGAHGGLLAPIVNGLVLPHVGTFAGLVKYSELGLGPVLLIGAMEIGRRRFAGRFGARHAYEAPVALVAAIAGLTAAALTLSIALLMGEGLPTVMPDRAFTTAVPVELLIVPLGLAVAWLEFGRLLVLDGRRRPRSPSRRSPPPSQRSFRGEQLESQSPHRCAPLGRCLLWSGLWTAGRRAGRAGHDHAVDARHRRSARDQFGHPKRGVSGCRGQRNPLYLRL